MYLHIALCKKRVQKKIDKGMYLSRCLLRNPPVEGVGALTAYEDYNGTVIGLKEIRSIYGIKSHAGEGGLCDRKVLPLMHP